MLAFLNNLLTCQNPNPDLARRGRLLAIFMITVMLLDLALLANNLANLADPAYTPEDIAAAQTNAIQDAVTFGVFLLLLVLNHRGHQRSVAFVFLCLSLLFTLFFKPADIAIFAIIYVPFIIVSSFVLAPAAAFLFAAICSAAYNLYTYSDPVAWAMSWSIITPIAFFCIGSVSWLAGRSYERALRGEREQTAKVRQAYEESTARAQELAETLRREHETLQGRQRPDDPRMLQGLSQRLWQEEYGDAGAQLVRSSDALEQTIRDVAGRLGVPPDQVMYLVNATLKERIAPGDAPAAGTR